MRNFRTFSFGRISDKLPMTWVTITSTTLGNGHISSVVAKTLYFLFKYWLMKCFQPRRNVGRVGESRAIRNGGNKWIRIQKTGEVRKRFLDRRVEGGGKGRIVYEPDNSFLNCIHRGKRMLGGPSPRMQTVFETGVDLGL